MVLVFGVAGGAAHEGGDDQGQLLVAGLQLNTGLYVMHYNVIVGVHGGKEWLLAIFLKLR